MKRFLLISLIAWISSAPIRAEEITDVHTPESWGAESTNTVDYIITGESGTEYEALMELFRITGSFHFSRTNYVWNTTSVGRVRKITITGNSDAGVNTVYVYAQNGVAFGSYTGLSHPSEETLIGEIVYDGGVTGELEIEGDYEFIFLKQKENNLPYVDEFTVTWDVDDEQGTPLEDGSKFDVSGLYYSVVSCEEQTVEVTWGGETQTSGTESYAGEVTIPSSVRYKGVTYTVVGIGNSAFRNCAELTEVTIPEMVTSIGDYSFYQCSSLSELKIPDSVTSLGTNLCYECTSLTSLTLGKNIDTIGNNAFYGCTELTEVEIPINASTIEESAFRYCTKLEKVTMESGASQINDYAFADCLALKSFDVPESVTKLGSGVFLNDAGLEEVFIGENVESLGEQAFKDCSSLSAVTTYNETPPTCGVDAFSGIAEDCVLYIPVGTYDDYSTADTWQDFFSCVEMNGLLVETLEATDVTATTATLHARAVAPYDEAIVERGFECWVEDEPNVVTTIKVEGDNFAFTLEDFLVPETTYVYRAYAISASYFVYGEELSFTTSQEIPEGIDSVSADSSNGRNVEGIYSASGQKLNSLQNGVNILRMNDGTMKKILMK